MDNFLEAVGVIAISLASLFFFINLLSWMGDKIQDDPYCYYEKRTSFVSNDTDDRVYKRVFVDCPE